jgi:membrane protease YdiL (CAAX protease family)
MENNPFSGIKTYDNYSHLWQLTAFIIFTQFIVSLLVAGLVLHSGLHLTPFETILPAMLVTGFISWSMLDGIGVSWRGAFADWNRNAQSDLKKALKYFAGYGLLLLSLFAILGAALWFLGDGMEKLVQPLSDRSVKVDSLLRGVAAASRPRFLLVLFSACVAAPVIEEIFFRRIIYTTIRLKKGFWFSAFWSGLLFAVFHGVAAPVILPVGMYACWVYERERRLPVNIMLHSMINFSMITLKVLV